MTKRWNIEGQGFDFDALMLSKSWAELSSEERKLLDGVVSGEEEYGVMRDALLAISSVPDSADGLVMKPSVRNSLMELFDKEHGSPVNAGKGKRAVRISRPMWISGAAAAALLLIAAMWWLVLQPGSDTVVPDPVELAMKTPEETTLLPSEDPIPAGSSPMHTKEQNQEHLPAQKPLISKEVFAENRFADAETDEVVSFRDTTGLIAVTTAFAAEEITLASRKAARDLDTEKAELFQYKTVVSARADTSQGKLKMKDPVPLSRNISQDPLLVGFLYECR